MAQVYLNNEEVVSIIESTRSELTEEDVSRETFRFTYDTLTRILEQLNNVSSIVVNEEN